MPNNSVSIDQDLIDQQNMAAGIVSSRSPAMSPVPPSMQQANPILSALSATPASTAAPTPSSTNSPAPTSIGGLKKSVNDTYDAIQQTLEENNALKKEYIEAKKHESALQGQQAEIIMDKSTADQQIKRVEDTAELKRQNSIYDLFQAMGGQEEQLKLGEELKAAADKVKETQAAVQKEVAKTTPLARFLHLDNIGYYEEQVNMAEADYLKKKAAFMDINNALQTANQSYDKLKKTVNEAVISANQKVINTQAAIDASNALLAAQKSNAEQVLNVMAANESAANFHRQETAMLQSYRTFMLQKENRDAAMKELEEAKKSNELYAQYAIKGFKQAGRTDLDASTIIAMRDAGGETKAQTDAAFATGTRHLIPLTPSESLTNLLAVNREAVYKGDNPAYNVYMEALTAAQEAAVEAQYKPGTDAFDEYVKAELDGPNGFDKKMKDYEANIDDSDTKNPNIAPPMSAIIDTTEIKALNNPLIELVYRPLIVGGRKDIPAQEAFTMGIKAIKTKGNPEGKIKFEDFIEGYSRIYLKAADINNAQQDRARNWIPLQTSYNIQFKDIATSITVAGAQKERLKSFESYIEGFPFLAKPTITDVTKQEQLRAAALAQLNREAFFDPNKKVLLDVDAINRKQGTK